MIRPGQAKGPSLLGSPVPTPAIISTLLARWINFTVTFAQLSTDDTVSDYTLWTPPAGTVLHMSTMKHSAAFTGGTLTAYTLQAGLAVGADYSRYLPAFDVFQAPGASIYNFMSNHDGILIAAGMSVNIRALTGTASFLDQATAGSALFQFYVSNLNGTALP
jgi:hypothetical protein